MARRRRAHPMTRGLMNGNRRFQGYSTQLSPRKQKQMVSAIANRAGSSSSTTHTPFGG